jgi:hypothetical protein
MDGGPTDGPPGETLKSVTVQLSPEEAYELLESLRVWAEEIEAGQPDEGWHAHITDGDGNELTIAIPLPP